MDSGRSILCHLKGVLGSCSMSAHSGEYQMNRHLFSWTEVIGWPRSSPCINTASERPRPSLVLPIILWVEGIQYAILQRVEGGGACAVGAGALIFFDNSCLPRFVGPRRAALSNERERGGDHASLRCGLQAVVAVEHYVAVQAGDPRQQDGRQSTHFGVLTPSFDPSSIGEARIPQGEHIGGAIEAPIYIAVVAGVEGVQQVVDGRGAAPGILARAPGGGDDPLTRFKQVAIAQRSSIVASPSRVVAGSDAAHGGP